MEISQEIIGLSIILITALIGAVVMLVRALGKAGETNMKINESVIKLNDEVQEQSSERRKWQKERETFEKKLAAEKLESTRAIAKVREDAEEADKLITDELIKFKVKVTTQEGQIQTLTRDNEQLVERVNVLEEEAIKKDQKIQELIVALDQSEKDKRELANEIKALVERLNNKADKPEPTPDPPPNPTAPVSQVLPGGKKDGEERKEAA